MDDEILDFWRHAQNAPDHIALVDEKLVKWPAGRVLAEANRISHGLQSLGISPGNVVAVLMPQCAELILTWLAVTQIGAYLVVLNPKLPLEQSRFILSDSGAGVLLVHKGAVGSRVVGELISLSGIICVPIGDIPGCRQYAEVFSCCPTSAPSQRTLGAVLAYTSGSTGRPKAVLRQVAHEPPEVIMRPLIRWFMQALGVSAAGSGAHLCTCPLYFGAPLLYASCALHLGHTLVLMPGWNPRLALQLLESHAITTTFMVPFQFISLLQLPADVRARYSTSSLEAVIHGSAPCPVAIKQAMLDWWGDVIFEVYAATEMGATVASPSDWRAFPGTVGRMASSQDLRIYDEHGEELPPGRPGTIFMRRYGTNAFIYKNDPEKTQAQRLGDFVTVGDVGYKNEAGFLFLLDRRDDLIICRGEHIYPALVESVFAGHPLVADCVAFGVPHAEWGEEVRVAVQLVSGVTASADVASDLERFLRSGSAVQLPAVRVELVEQIPRDESGKLQRRRMRK